MSAQYFLIAVVALSAVAWTSWATRGREAGLQALWQRSCSGRAWKRAFPEAPKQEIRKFLLMFVESFAFSQNCALQFLPSDRVLAIYRTLYPRGGVPDALEVETLAKDLDKEYGVSLAEIWNEELTLGQIFGRCRASAA